MKSWIFGLFLFFLLITAPQCSSSKSNCNPGDPSMEPSTRMDVLKHLLPRDNFLEGWTRQGDAKLVSGDELEEILGPDSNAILQFSPVGGAFQKYSKGEDLLTVSVLDMGDIRGSFGGFSLSRNRAGEVVKVGKGGYYSKGKLSFWEANYLVGIYGEGEFSTLKDQTIFLGRTINKSIKGCINKDFPPPLTEYLPENGRVPHTAMYFRSTIPSPLLSRSMIEEDWLGLNRGTEGVLVDYCLGKDNMHLLLVKYPDQGSAEGVFNRLRDEINRGEEASPLPFSKVSGFFSPSSGNRRSSFLFFRRGKFLGGIIDFESREKGEKIAQELDLLLVGSGE